VPIPVFLKEAVAPILACGAELKNTICLTKGNRAFHFISDVLVAKQLTIRGAMGASTVGYQWASRQIDTDPRIDDLVSHQFPLSESSRALQAAAGLLGREELISVAVTF